MKNSCHILLLALLLCCGLPFRAAAGPILPDTLPATQATVKGDSVPAIAPRRKAKTFQEFQRSLLARNLFLKDTRQPVFQQDIMRHRQPQEFLFYLIAGILLLLAILRIIFYKYFTDMFRAFFNPTLSNRQLKEQLQQASLPSLLFNIFYCISFGVYLFLLLQYFKYIVAYNVFELVPALIILIGIIYLAKYVLLQVSGWIFGSNEVVGSYIFILYLINKIIGIILLPFLILLAFCSPPIAEAGYYISLVSIIVLIGYRYIRSYGLIRNHITFSKFHFFLYLCAFEIIPVLVIARVVLIWLNGGA